MIKSLYIINLKTNMHVGSGEESYGIIDNQIQRDVVNNYPTIHSSSLKGALREYFECIYGKEDRIIKDIFGSSSNSGDDISAGKYKFFAANLLSLPVRSDIKPFFRAICPEIIREFIQYLEDFDIKFKEKKLFEEFYSFVLKKVETKKPIVFEKNEEKIIIEDFDDVIGVEFNKIKTIEKLFGKNIAVFSDEDFKSIVDELPVIARNQLDNGESKNLWYEEIVPRETKFYFAILKTPEHNKKFDEILTKGFIQFGANASIGYGYTKINKVGD